MDFPFFETELLESRRMLDATATLDSNGVYRVTATDSTEAIVVALNDAGDEVRST